MLLKCLVMYGYKLTIEPATHYPLSHANFRRLNG